MLILAGSVLLGGGCAGSYEVERSGFLGEDVYARLDSEGYEVDTMLVWESQTTSSDRFTAFRVEPVDILVDGTSRGDDISDERREDLSLHFQGQVELFLGEHFELVDERGPGVFVVQAAVTDLRDAIVPLNIHPATSITGLGLGAAAMEAKVSDGITGEVVFAMIGSRHGSAFGLEKLDPWGHAKEAMEIWALELAGRVSGSPSES